MSHFLRKLALLFTRKRFRSELDEEMAFHRAETEKLLLADGISPESARRAANRQFGNTTLLCERSREAVGFRVETVLQDLRFAIRQMQKSPGFAITAAFILALGMGVNIGLVCAVGASLLMRSLLFGVRAWDVPTLAAVAFLLGAASLAASFLPARRAASVNPTDALRAE